MANGNPLSPLPRFGMMGASKGTAYANTFSILSEMIVKSTCQMDRYTLLKARIGGAAAAAGRSALAVELLAVSKKQPLERIERVIAAGQHRFGENYVDEALAKMSALDQHALEWHFIGPIQSNKTRALAECFDWVHSVDRLKLIRRLAEQRPSNLPPLNVLLQVNLDAEPQKAGCLPEEIDTLAAAVDEAPNLRLRGLMAIPAPRTDPAEQRAVFERLAALQKTLAERYPDVDTLSAGMSDDLEAAIAAGSTMVRVGTDLFGPRPD